MKRKTKGIVIGVALLLCTVLVSGCAKGTENSTEKGAKEIEDTVVEKETSAEESDKEVISSTEAIDKFSTLPTYEYTSEEYWCDNLCGRLWKPKTEEKVPLVIFAHGCGGFYYDGGQYAEIFAQYGIATYSFDFVGGGLFTQSGGETKQMSAVTEAKDIKQVLEAVQTWDFVDREQIYVFGESLGGLAALIASGECQELMDGMILLYPAFMNVAVAQQYYGSEEMIPEEWESSDGMVFGKGFYADLLDVDMVGLIENYKGPVFLAQGSEDEIVGTGNARGAAKMFPDVKYCEYEGQGHGFDANGMQMLMNDMYDFFVEKGVIK